MRAKVQVIIPCKGFGDGKQRLAACLAPAARRRLNHWLLTRAITAVVRAGVEPTRCVVVSADTAARGTAHAYGLGVVEEPPGFGLNAAVALAKASEHCEGAAATLVMPVDLPFADDSIVRALVERAVTAVERETILIVANRDGEGTNALAVPTPIPFEFCFGAASLARHSSEAIRHGLGVTRYSAPALAFDVDTPDDLGVWMSDSRFPVHLRDALVNPASK